MNTAYFKRCCSLKPSIQTLALWKSETNFGDAITSILLWFLWQLRFNFQSMCLKQNNAMIVYFDKKKFSKLRL